ncbi:MAG: prephenate dehydrogenase [Flammeovirgaceae bacterium]
MTVGIIGLGLIGGSMALALRNNGFAQKFIGTDKNFTHCEQALILELVDEVVDLETLCQQADLIILAIPVDKSKFVLRQILDLITDGQIVTDMGSTKAEICQHVADHPRRNQYVAAHPIAGTEYSGPKAAIPNLYFGKRSIICEKEKTLTEALIRIEMLFASLNMQILYMDAAEHDKHAAYISHLSHITSFSLGLAVLDIEKDEKQILDMAGSGFASTVRLAKSSSAMWAPIFLENDQNLLDALDRYIHYMKEFKAGIEQKNEERLTELMEKANDIKRIL